MENLIYCITDKRYFALTQLFIHIIDVNYPTRPYIMVQHNGLTPRQINRLQCFKRVICSQFNDPHRFQDYPVMKAHRLVSPVLLYGRFNIWSSPLFDQFDSILYLDVDTIVCGSLDSLLRRRSFFIVQDAYSHSDVTDDAILVNTASKDVSGLLAADNIVLPPCGGNAGVMLIPRCYRTEAHGLRLLSIASRYRAHLRWADQSVINLWAAQQGITFAAEYEYNLQSDLLAMRSVEPKVKIIHLNAMSKAMRLGAMWLAYLVSRLCGSTRVICGICTICVAVDSALYRFTNKIKAVKPNTWLGGKCTTD